MKKVLLATFILIQIASFLRPTQTQAAPTGNYIEFSGGSVEAAGSSVSPVAVSIQAWIMPENEDAIIVSIGNKTGTAAYDVTLNGGSLQLRYRYGAGSIRVLSAGNIPLNTWSLVGITIDAQDTKLFVNGSMKLRTPGATGLLPLGPSIVVGHGFTPSFFGNGAFRGAMDDFGISDVLLWHFDESRGTPVATDASGNGRHGQLVGGDSAVHFHGVLPTPTPWVFPTSGFPRPTFSLPPMPTLSFPRITPSGSTIPDQPMPTFTVPTIRNTRPTGLFPDRIR